MSLPTPPTPTRTLDSPSVGPADPPPRFEAQRWTLPRIFWPILALIGLLLFNLAFSRRFFHLEVIDGRLAGSLVDIPRQATAVMLMSLGMTLVIATGGVDLSVGAVLAVAGAIAAVLARDHGASLPLILLIVAAASLLLGAWNGALVALFGVQPIVATLILMVAGRGIAQLLAGGQVVSFDPQSHRALAYIGGGYFAGLPFSLTLVALALAGTAALTRLTALGLFIEAVGDNPSAARYAGVHVRGVTFFAYAFTGLCAGMAGLVYTSNINAADPNNAGIALELDAILAVVIGGTALTGGRFSLVGAMVGALIIQTLTTTILTRGVEVAYTQVIKALVVLGVCLLQSDRLRQNLRQWRTAAAWRRGRS